MRLIDADKLKKDILLQNILGEPIQNIIDRYIHIVDNQPTAFDAEKVTESLMNRFRVVSNDEDLEWNRAIDYAIRILEGGGVE